MRLYEQVYIHALNVLVLIPTIYSQGGPGYAVLSVNKFQSHEQYSNYPHTCDILNECLVHMIKNA